MNKFKTKKFLAFLAAVMIMVLAVIGAIMQNGKTVFAVTDNSAVMAGGEEQVTTSVKIKNGSNVLWKAKLSEYNSSFSLTDYEKVEDKEAEESVSEEMVESSDYSLDYVNGATTYAVPDREAVSYADITSGNFGFTTYGYGHGLGMSQNGANFYATYGGWGYQSILAHYYPGTYIQNTGTASDEIISAGGVSGSTLDIVSRVVYNEVSDSMNVEVMKAQAVAVYSYIKYKGGAAYDLYPRSSAPEAVVNAVRQVLGEALYYDGDYALAMFGASSGGATASCYDIFYEDIPYLRSVPSEYDAQCDPHYGTVVSISASEVRNTLEANLGITLSDDPGNWIQIIEGDGGYAAQVCIDGQVTIKGNDLKCYLGLKSPKFTCEYYY